MSLNDAAPKLKKLIPLLSSDQDGEVVAAVRALGRTLKAAGSDFHTLAEAMTGSGSSGSGGTVSADEYAQAVCEQYRIQAQLDQTRARLLRVTEELKAERAKARAAPTPTPEHDADDATVASAAQYMRGRTGHNDWEVDFLKSVLGRIDRGERLSPKQQSKLVQVARDHGWRASIQTFDDIFS